MKAKPMFEIMSEVITEEWSHCKGIVHHHFSFEEAGAEAGAFLAIHMTWGGHDAHAAAARRAAREMEAALRPFGARPHWGKLFHAGHTHGAGEADLASISEMYGERLTRFKALCVRHDPTGKLRQAEWVRRVLGPFHGG